MVSTPDLRRRRLTVWIASSVACVGAGAAAAHADDKLHFAISRASVEALDSDGMRLWRFPLAHGARPHLHQQTDGTLRLSIAGPGTATARTLWLARDGRWLARRGDRAIPPGTPGRSELGSFGCAAWDEPTVITPPPTLETQSDALEALLVDSAGDAWAIQSRHDGALGGRNLVRSARSLDHAGLWLPAETLYDTENFTANFSADVGANDVITIAFRDIESPDYRLLTLRHDPAGGWGPLTVVDASPDFFQRTATGADAAGNVAVVTNRDDGGIATIFSSAFEAASGSWLPRARVSPAGAEADEPRIARSADRTDLYLVYIVYTGTQRGLYAHRWDPTTTSWGAATFVPGSQSAAQSSGGVLAAATPGALTVIWEGGPPGLRSIVGSRLVSGAWEQAEILLGPDAETYLDFGAIDAAPDGRVIAMLSRFAGPLIRFWALRYLPGTGWLPAENPYSIEYAFQTYDRVRLIDDRRAIATMVGVQDDQPQLTSLRFDGTAWLSDPLDIPGEELTFDQEMRTEADDTLLVYVPGQVFGAVGGVNGTWLRTRVGDLNCDGCVDLTDLSGLLVDFGCAAPDRCAADLNGDGVTDLTDLSLLLAEFGAGCG